jgi:hypothetical protein
LFPGLTTSIVYEISCSGGLINAGFTLALHESDSRILLQNMKELEQSMEVKADGDCLYYAARMRTEPTLVRCCA